MQRPSSAVKELVENNIEADSSTISVTVKDGGLKLIQAVGKRFQLQPLHILFLVDWIGLPNWDHPVEKIALGFLDVSKNILLLVYRYGNPILNIKWHQTLNSTEPKLITADKHIVRVWDPNTGNNVSSIERDNGSINDVCIFSNSGLMLLALDNSQIHAHFIPALGPAPNWHVRYSASLQDL
ncbi:hypothetical protein ZWY2020_003808 [Hordeum vulgare]|nr:hypothetical protein ZWY2020_003808 [Hordeum vulgare]